MTADRSTGPGVAGGPGRRLPAEDQMSVVETTTAAGRREGERPGRRRGVVASVEDVHHRHLEIHQVGGVGDGRIDGAHGANTTGPCRRPGGGSRSGERN